MTPTPPASSTGAPPSRKAVAAIAAIVVVAAAVGAGVLIGHRNHSSKSSTSTTVTGGKNKKTKPCTKRRQRLGKCSPTSTGGTSSSRTTTTHDFNNGPPPTGTLPSLAFTGLPSRMGLATGVQLWDADFAKQDSEISGIAASGAKWVRTALNWSDVEPTSASLDDWSNADHIVTDAQKAGLGVIFDVDSAPDWAGAAASGEFGNDPQLYANFVAKAATRYRDTVRVYELGNEPNHTHQVNHPDPATFAKVLRLAYPAIKAADPNAFVLSGGIGGINDTGGDIDPVTFVRGMYANGAKGFFDGLAYHPYTYPELPATEISVGDRGWSRMLAVRSLMEQNGDGSKPIWITEFGAPTTGAGSVSQQQQSAIMSNGFGLWKTYSWAGVMCWFTYIDKGTDPSAHKGYFGIVDGSGAHKASWSTFSTLAHGG